MSIPRASGSCVPAMNMRSLTPPLHCWVPKSESKLRRGRFVEFHSLLKAILRLVCY